MKYQLFQELGVDLFPILVDSKKNAQKMEERYAKNKFPIYFDEKNEIASKLHQQIIWHKLGRMPGLLILDSSGVIQYAYYSDNMHDIPKNALLFEKIRELQGKK